MTNGAGEKFRAAARIGWAALVVDGVLPPWQACGVEVRGRADIFPEGGEGVNLNFDAEVIRVHPTRTIGWRIDTDPYHSNSRLVG